eukprot:TRINITY_DN61328_c0_g1_i1.p1 TRINITY_DN61328_c0_g1~~TRINITY_DN61328_c0_g1_i1.p1  ORF type:complete len:518 (-),score=62.33 TRINITY_DN61328_c0_g1_i1:46-1599(-)
MRPLNSRGAPSGDDARPGPGKTAAQVAASSAALSSGLPAELGRATANAGQNALRVLTASRKHREQQDALLQRAEQELLKAARRAQAAIEKRVGGSPDPGMTAAAPAVDSTPLSPRRRRQSAQSTISMARSPRLAWCSEPDDGAEDQDQTSYAWRRSERTVNEYVSRRTVGMAEYSQVCQRYSGHLDTLKQLCDTVGRNAAASSLSWPPTPSSPRSPPNPFSAKKSGELPDGRDGKALRQRSTSPFVQTREVPKIPAWAFPSRGHDRTQVASPRRRSPSPRATWSPRSPRQTVLQAGQAVATVNTPPVRSAPVTPVNTTEVSPEPSVAMPLLSMGVLSATPLHSADLETAGMDDLSHVRSLFLAQVPEANVLSIYRVENHTLRAVYSAVREAMGNDCELDLWHGTAAECVPNIVRNGFNRAYSGRHGTRLGHGSYFSASASYSIRFCDKKCLRRIVFFSKVLVGTWTRGSPDLVEPPHKDKDCLSRYDSTVDDPDHPLNFCIFRDYQALPTHLLEFTL